MDVLVKYKSEYEHYPPQQMYYKRIRYNLAHERFVVPWQMEESEKPKAKTK